MLLRRSTVGRAGAVKHGLMQVRLKSTAAFKVLDGMFDASAPRHQDAVKKNLASVSLYDKLMEQVKAGGGPKGIKRHTELNKKILVRDRLKMILDDDSDTFEIAPLAGLGMDYGDVVCAGGITVIGKVSGRYCLLLASDATVKGGAVYPIGVEKHLRAQEIGYVNRLPCINLIDSGGAYLPLQSEMFMSGGRTFRNQAVMQADNLAQITIVCGSCTAGAAYVPTMSHEAIMVKRISCIYLAGPPLVKAATGEEVTNEELGGADVHCRISGCADHMAETESEAYEICRGVVETLNLPLVQLPDNYDEPLHSSEDLPNFVGLINVSKDDIYKILSRILDSSRFQEFKTVFGSNLVTGFGYIGGILTGVIANCGQVTSKDALKGAHFVCMCEYRNIPLFFLQYSLPNACSEGIAEVEDGITLKDRAKMMAAVACTKVPRISINIGGCYGDDNYTMSGRAFSPNFLLSWPAAITSTSTLNEEQVMQESDFSKFESAWDMPPTSAFSCAFNMFNDGVILPQETRKVLIQCLRIMRNGQAFQNTNNYQPRPIFRM